MNASQSLKRRVEILEPAHIENFLLLRGWTKTGEIPGRASVWNSPGGQSDAEILLPIDRSLRDYLDRAIDVCNTLAQFYSLATTQIVHEIDTAFYARIRISLEAPDVANGTIPVKDGVLAFSNAKDLLVSAVLASANPRRYFPNNRPNEVSLFVEDLRLGQTEIGSYAINIHIPLRNYESNANLDPGESFGQRVTRTLSNALQSVQEATAKFYATNDISVFDSIVASGGSANLCDALSGLSGENHSRNIRIAIDHSNLRAKDESHYEFSHRELSVLPEAAAFLRADYTIPDYTVSGYVVRLDRPASHADGYITVPATIEGKQRNVQIHLSPENYEIAIRAHESQKPILCIGELHLQPRSTQLRDVNEIKTLAVPEEGVFDF